MSQKSSSKINQTKENSGGKRSQNFKETRIEFDISHGKTDCIKSGSSGSIERNKKRIREGKEGTGEEREGKTRKGRAKDEGKIRIVWNNIKPLYEASIDAKNVKPVEIKLPLRALDSQSDGAAGSNRRGRG